MAMTVTIPDDLARSLQSEWTDLPQKVLEAVVLEAYRQGILSQGKVGEVLGFDFEETEAFLRERDAYLLYEEDDLSRDRAAFDRIQNR